MRRREGGRGCHGWPKGSSACLEGRVDGRIDSGLLPTGVDAVVVGELASMPHRHDTSRNAADACIVVMEVLLGMIIGNGAHH